MWRIAQLCAAKSLAVRGEIMRRPSASQIKVTMTEPSDRRRESGNAVMNEANDNALQRRRTSKYRKHQCHQANMPMPEPAGEACMSISK